MSTAPPRVPYSEVHFRGTLNQYSTHKQGIDKAVQVNVAVQYGQEIGCRAQVSIDILDERIQKVDGFTLENVGADDIARLGTRLMECAYHMRMEAQNVGRDRDAEVKNMLQALNMPRKEE
jgi:hypothetical protein